MLSKEPVSSLGGAAVTIATIGGAVGQALPPPWGAIVTGTCALIGAILVAVSRSQVVPTAKATEATATALQMIPLADPEEAAKTVKQLVTGKVAP
jgi:hypothetical protein